MRDGFIPKYSRVGGQKEEKGTARHFNKPPLPSKHLPLLSIPAFKLPTPSPLHSFHSHPFPPSHFQTPHTHFPTKRLLSGPHAGQMFLMTLMPAAHQHDATNPVKFSANSPHPGAHTPRGKRKKGRGKRQEEELKNMYANPTALQSDWICLHCPSSEVPKYHFSALGCRKDSATLPWVCYRLKEVVVGG